MTKPEEKAREQIDTALAEAGWTVQDRDQANPLAARGVAIREYPLKPGYGFADYLLYVDQKAAGVVEAKKVGTPLTGVTPQARHYSEGLRPGIPRAHDPLPFLYQSTGIETSFFNQLDPDPRTRPVFTFHRPETLAQWLRPPADLSPDHPLHGRPATLRARVHHLPSLPPQGLWPAQGRAIENLEASLRQNRPRALVQMATGSGKTFTAISSAYRLIKFGGARRVLFLVDRANLGRQALKEFQQFVTPDDGRKFTELYNVQHLASSKLQDSARVVISTIQRLYSILQGEDLAPEDEERSSFETLEDLRSDSIPVAYNHSFPIETFDVVFIDECHRSIYSLWRQVVQYFDAFLIGLTATPSQQTFGFFDRNLVMEYRHAEAVADGVNVDYDVYRIRTRITAQGSVVEAGNVLDYRDRRTRAPRWEQLDEAYAYAASQLDRDVVAVDQIRTIIRTFHERLFTEIFPGRTEVPKTLIYAKDDSHADDIVRIVREEFGRGDDFAEKITYRTSRAEDMIAAFRTSPMPRIAVTVDMIATGTDIKPLEVVMFLRTVRSRNFFDQMKGRGVRVIPPTELRRVTPDEVAKDHFVLVDCAGVCESKLSDSYTLERQRTVKLDSLLEAVAFGNRDPDILSSVASRLARLDRRLGEPERRRLAELAGGRTLHDLVSGIVAALNPDRQAEEVQQAGLPAGQEPSEEQLAAAEARLLQEAAAPLASNPALRNEILHLRERHEQAIDRVSLDEVLVAEFSDEARDKAESLVRSFEQFIQDHLDEITALQVLYSRPYHARLRFRDIRDLAETLNPPYSPSLLEC